MDMIFITVGMPCFLIGGAVYARWVSTRWQQSLSEVAHHFGWAYRKSGAWLSNDALKDELSGMVVRVEIVKKRSGNNNQQYTQVIVVPTTELLQTIELSRESFTDRIGQFLGGKDIQLGVPYLDERHKITGVESSVLALFTHAARELLWTDALENVFLKEGRIECFKPGHVNDSQIIIELIEKMVALGLAFDSPGGTPQERLARNVAHDPDTDIRMRCLGALLEKWPRSEQTLAVAAEYLDGDVPTPLRLMAASSVLGLSQGGAASDFTERTPSEEGALSALRSIIEDASIVDGQRADALEALVPFLKSTSDISALLARPFGESAKARYFPRLAMSVMGIATHRKISLPFEIIEPYLTDEDVAESAAQALEFVVGPRVRSALLSLLSHEHEPIARNAAVSLGRTADITAVHPLLQRADGMLVGADLKNAVRAAVALLQSRANKESLGGLTVANDEFEGGLSRPLSDRQEPSE